MLWLKHSASLPISRSQQKPPSSLEGGFCCLISGSALTIYQIQIADFLRQIQAVLTESGFWDFLLE